MYVLKLTDLCRIYTAQQKFSMDFIFVFILVRIQYDFFACRRNLVLTDLLAFAIDFWMLPRYIPEHFGIFSEV